MFITKEERKALSILAKGVEKIILEHKNVKKSIELLDIFLDNEISYAVDVETMEIIWANENTKNVFGEIEGKKCHDVLQGFCEQCVFCKLDTTKTIPNKPYKWIHENKINGRTYLVEDTYLPNGFNGFHKPAHFERAIDITDI